MKKSILVLIFASFYFVSLSQNKISGTVYDNTTKEVLPTVVVYIPNLHKDTMTDKDGKFEIDDLSTTSFKLIVSLIGYQTKVVDVNKDNLLTQKLIHHNMN